MSRRFLLTFFFGVTGAALLIVARAVNSVADATARRNTPASQTSTTLSPAQGPADLVLTNAKIETMDDAHAWAGALAIRGESIVAVSSITRDTEDLQKASTVDAPDIKPWLGAKTRVIDLRGAFVMPGFNDAHVHIANSLALKIAGVTQDTADPARGHIVRDPQTSQPTGLLQEDGAKNLVFSKMAAPSSAERRRGIELVLADAARNGITSLQDCSYLEISRDVSFSKENLLIYQQLRREGKLTARITEWLDFTLPVATLEALRKEWGSTDPWLKTGALKAFLDGSLGSRTAALLAPYSDAPGTSGLLHLDAAKLALMAIARDRAGFQLAFHAIGDRANRVALDTFAAVVAANGPRDRRDRVEHAQIVAPEDFARYGSLDIIASMQPSHLLDDERWASDRLGPERSRGAYAWRTMQQNGVHLAFGTDHPVEPLNPLRGIYACVTRELPQGSASWQPQESLPIKDCLRAYTTGSAYAE